MKKKLTFASLLILLVFIGCQDETILSVEQNDLNSKIDLLNSKISIEGQDLYALYPWNSDDFKMNPADIDFNNIALYTYDPITDNIALNENNTNYLEPNKYYGFDYNPNDNLVYLLKSDNYNDIGKSTSKRDANNRNLYSYNLETNEVEFIQSIISYQGNYNPQDLTFDNNGTLYFVFKNGEVNSFNLDTKTISSFANVPTGGGVGLTYNFDTNSLIYSYRNDDMFTKTKEANVEMNNLISIAIPSGITSELFSFSIGSSSIIFKGLDEDEGFNCNATAQAIEYVGNGKCIASSTFGCDVIYTIDLITEETEILLNPTGSFEDIKDLMLIGENNDYDNDGVLNDKDRHPYSNTSPMLNLNCLLDTENQMVKRGTWMNDEIQDVIDLVNAMEDVSDRRRTNRFKSKMYIIVNNWRYKYRLIDNREKRTILACVNSTSYPFNNIIER